MSCQSSDATAKQQKVTVVSSRTKPRTQRFFRAERAARESRSWASTGQGHALKHAETVEYLIFHIRGQMCRLQSPKQMTVAAPLATLWLAQKELALLDED